MPYKLPKRVYSAPSTIHGKGLFARIPLYEGDYIGTYSGIRTQREGRHVLWVTENGRSVGRDGLNLLRYLNHSKQPNAEFDGYDLFASEDIDPDEEITINYGDED